MSVALCPQESVELPRRHKSSNPRPAPLTQALDVRDALYDRLSNETLTPGDHAKLARAWKEACELVRDLQGHGKPRPVTARNDPDAKSRSKPRAGLPEPIDAEKR